MDFRNKQAPETNTLVNNNSMGEALSVVCTGLMHPEGDYPNLGPRIWNWLNRAYPVDTQRHNILHPGASRVSSWGRLRDAEQGRAPCPVVGRFSQFNFADVFQAAVEENLLRCRVARSVYARMV
jgi:hypothetical protein